MINLIEVICHPSPPLPISVSSTVPFTVLICRLCDCYRCHCCQCSISHCRCPCPLFISVTVAMSLAFANAIVVAIVLSSSAPVPISVLLLSLYVCSYSLTFPRLYPFWSLGCNKLELDPLIWWWLDCHALRTSWYCSRHQPWSIW